MQSYFLPIWEALQDDEERKQYCDTIIVSASSGIDSFALMIRARQQWPNREIIVHHQHLAEAWESDLHYLKLQCKAVGNCRLVASQGIYETTGEVLDSGAYGVRMAKIHTIYDNGHIAEPIPPTDDWLEGRPSVREGLQLTSLLDLAVVARFAPPTNKIRYCTSYLKSSVFDAWFHASGLKATMFLTGERHSESSARSRLPEYCWRFNRNKNDARWWRGIVDLAFHEALEMVLEYGPELIPESYGWQHNSGTVAGFIDEYRNPDKDERGRPRRSCQRCIYTTLRSTNNLRQHNPEASRKNDERTDRAEIVMGKTWRQSDMKGKTSVSTSNNQ